MSAGARHESCLVWLGDDRVEFSTRARPQAERPYVVADVHYAGICGSDLHQYRGGSGPRRPPLILGHEAVVTVEGRDGMFVLFPLVCCGECDACVRGEENLCERRGLIGLDRPGVFADSVVVDEAALVAVPDGMDPQVAVLTEPLAASVSALRIAGMVPSTRLAVIGCGPIGLLAVHAAAHAGVHPIVADPLPSRREIALRLGARRHWPTPPNCRRREPTSSLTRQESRPPGAPASPRYAPAAASWCSASRRRRAPSRWARWYGAGSRCADTTRTRVPISRRRCGCSPPARRRSTGSTSPGWRTGESFRRIVQSPEKVTKVILTTIASPAGAALRPTGPRPSTCVSAARRLGIAQRRRELPCPPNEPRCNGSLTARGQSAPALRQRRTPTGVRGARRGAPLNHRADAELNSLASATTKAPKAATINLWLAGLFATATPGTPYRQWMTRRPLASRRRIPDRR